MSLFRRRLLIAAALEQQGGGGESDMGYIKDGLVFHLDGINKGSDSTAWTDLVNGFKFIYKDCIINPDNVEFDGGKSCAYNNNPKDLQLMDYNAEGHTMEICVGMKGVMNYEVIFMPSIGRSNLVAAYSHAYLVMRTESGPIKYSINGKRNMTMSYHYKKAMINKKPVIGAGLSEWSSVHDSRYRTIGCRFDNGENLTGNHYKGKIYSIRVYNRLLNDEEMLQNQQVDIKRFFGGVVPQ